MMNLSLKMNSHKLIVFCLLVLPIISQGQSKTKSAWVGSLQVGYGSAITPNNSYKNFMDTMQSKTNGVLVKGIHVNYLYSLSRKTDIMVGLGYNEAAFGRKQTGLNFDNYTYPGMGTGQIEDLSNIEKGIQYTYRYSYLQVPVQIVFNVARSRDFKWTYSIVPGGAAQILLNHQLVANLDGFSIEGEDRFTFDSTGFEARRIAFNLQLGYRLAHKEENGEAYYIQPMIGIYPLSVSDANNKAFPWFACVQAGWYFNFKSK